MNWFKYVSRALRVMGLLTTSVPKIMADGKVTVPEMAGFFVEVAAIFGWGILVDVPDHERTISFNANVTPES